MAQLEQVISRYKASEIIAYCGALSLLPENASRVFRIEALAHVAGSVKQPGTDRISPDHLQNLFCEPPLSGAIGEAEDPFPNIFVEEVPFFGGACRVFPGPIAGTSFQFQRLTESIFQNKELWPEDFTDLAYQVAAGVLVISDLLAERFGLKRGAAGNSSARGTVTVPTATKLHAMKKAVIFSGEEFHSYLNAAGAALKTLAGLVVNAGDIELIDYSVGNGTLLHKPIVKCQDDFIVAAPQRLLSAASQFLLNVILNTGLRDKYAELYPNRVMALAQRSLDYLRHAESKFCPNVPLNISGCRERVYWFDSDKILYLLVVCNVLDGFNQKTVDGVWSTPQLSQAIVERSQLVAREVFERAPRVNEILVLLVPSGINCRHELSLDNWPETIPCLAINPDNLEVIARIEAGNPLTLWRFALKSTEALKKRQMVFFDELDLFAAFRVSGYTYPGDGHEEPIGVVVKPGYGRRLKLKIANEQDWHPVRHFDPRFIVNVNCLYGTTSVPLYAPSDSGFPCVCVEGLACIFWVYPGQEIGESECAIYFEFVTMVAYWIWQISPFLKATIQDQMRLIEMMHVRVSLCSSILNRNPVLMEKAEPAVTGTVSGPGIVDVTFEEGFAFLMRAPDNRAERQMLQHLIQSIILASGTSLAATDDQTNQVVDKFAPCGIKRMLMHSELAYVPQMDPRDLPPHRAIQSGEVADIALEIGQHIRDVMELKPGPIPKAICNDVLKRMVSFCFNAISNLVRTLRPHRLTESLLAFHESLIKESTFSQLSIATRKETFEESTNIVSELAREMVEFAQAGVASRFIIEFVAAQPPSGFRPMGLAVHDRLQALASQLITLGSISDCLHFKVCEVELSLVSGRIEINHKAFVAAQLMQAGSLASSYVSNAEAEFVRHMGENPHPADLPPETADINRATKAEFGQSISDLTRFLTALGDISMDLRPITPTVLERSALLSSLASALNWDIEKIEACLALFSLVPRQEFMAPPPAWRPEDLYPWRFNRGLSYLRRPLIARKRYGIDEILWGHRHLDVARRYLVQLCSSTRLKARSPEMRSLLARFRDEMGKHFNNAVYEYLLGVPQLITRKQMSKFDGFALGNLGDIDVLCAEPQKRILWLIECKSLALARTPYEMRMHLESLTLGEKRPSIIQKHEVRTRWVERHLRYVLQELGIQSHRGWKARPLIVLDTQPLSPLLQQPSIPIISLEMLKSRWSQSILKTVYSDENRNP